MRDRVGLSWRPELAAGILTNLDRIDVVEVIADDYFAQGKEKVRSLRTLSAQVPVMLHGVSQGLASTAAASTERLDRLARVVGIVEPECWSEHLAFVRGGGYEIGHLAAPPRNGNTVEGTCRNLELARRIVGSTPMVENIATLIDPPGSQMKEATWLARIIRESGCGMLLDLHNLHANSVNFSYDPAAFLDEIPCDRVSTVHIAGGRRMAAGRLLDDHLHEVPDEVYELLSALAARTSSPLTVILERDGEYPRMECLIAELDRARQALHAGRQAAAA
jgi:uncharacterized protein (UPF0276 family)